MSIKEMLVKGPMNRQRIIHEGGSHTEYDAILAKADSLLDEAHVPELLSELVAIITPEFPDVKFSEKRLYVDGSVNFGLVWNLRFVSNSPKYECSKLEINVFPVREEIVIGREILTRKQWSVLDIVEDAIAAAYKNPAKWGSPEHT